MDDLPEPLGCWSSHPGHPYLQHLNRQTNHAAVEEIPDSQETQTIERELGLMMEEPEEEETDGGYAIHIPAQTPRRP